MSSGPMKWNEAHRAYRFESPSVSKIGPQISTLLNEWYFAEILRVMSGSMTQGVRGITQPRMYHSPHSGSYNERWNTILAFQKLMGGAHSYQFDCYADRCDEGEIATCDECDEGYVSCEECDGSGTNYCYECDGDGMVEEECEECEGSGQIQEDCEECGTFTGEAGQVECEDCEGEGTISEGDSTEDCEVCDGDGHVECVECDEGVISVECSECYGEGQIEVTCDYCDGDGEIRCDYCDEGSNACHECDGDWEGGECSICEGGFIKHPLNVEVTQYVLEPTKENKKERLEIWESWTPEVREGLFGHNPTVDFIPIESITRESLTHYIQKHQGVFTFLILPSRIPHKEKDSPEGIRIVVLTGPTTSTGYASAYLSQQSQGRVRMYEMKEGANHWRWTDLENIHLNIHTPPNPLQFFTPLKGQAILITTQISFWTPMIFLNQLKSQLTEETNSK